MPADDEVSLLTIGNILIRYRRLIVAVAIGGVLWGLSGALRATRTYVAEATFIPEGADRGSSELAQAASQFGIRVPTSAGAVWGPQAYVEIIHSRAVLESIALDTVVVAEQGGRRVAVMDLLGLPGPTDPERIHLAVQSLRGIVSASVVSQLGAVKVSARTRWPSASLGIAELLVEAVNEFNIETRKSKAAPERQFVEEQARESEQALRVAEDRLQAFLQRNRTIGSPQLTFEHQRLQREVTLRQELHTAWLKSREEARIREVRDTPVITVIEEPRLPMVASPRKRLQKLFFGGLVGGMLGVLLAFIANGVSRARRDPTEETREFFRLIEESKPGFLRRRRAARGDTH